MTDTQIQRGFAGDPAEARTVTPAGGCCGDRQATLTLADLAPLSGPCCGTAAEAQADNACCGTAAKSDAVAAGTGCCG
jgi:hypothetical protein